MVYRIAVLLKARCHYKKCDYECVKYCPRVRSGDETIVITEKGLPLFSEKLCTGCGICVHKCPFNAIKIINLSSELEGEIVHQYGENGFRLYKLPVLKEGVVTGLLGPNGIGKTTVVQILAGELTPNIGRCDAIPQQDALIKRFAGSALAEYFKKLFGKKIKTSLKPQYVDKLPAFYKGNIKTLLEKVDALNQLDQVCETLELTNLLNSNLKDLAGGELQRVAIAATILKDADVYFFDEPSSYLDIYQRLKVAKVIRELAEKKQVMVVEHDLAVLDFLADNTYLMYGSEGAYGVVAQPRVVRAAINTYLDGFMREENIRFRDYQIKFEIRPPKKGWAGAVLYSYPKLEKKFGGKNKSFTLTVNAGLIHSGEVVGVVGRNSTGKTTFVKMIAGIEQPTNCVLTSTLHISYKPQYIRGDFKGTVGELLNSKQKNILENTYFKSEVLQPLDLKYLFDREVSALSGGELQRVAIAVCLAQDADLYLFDEPSAYLDSNQRMEAARTIRRFMEKNKKSGFIVDHDLYFIDMVSDTIMVFGGEPAVAGFGGGPFEMREGMNKFLKSVDITFRRDKDTKRPRINKLDSYMDRLQKSRGEYYYFET